MESMRSLERRVDMLVLRSGMNDALLRQQLADRHVKMMARVAGIQIRAAKFKGKVTPTSRIFLRT